VYLRNADSQAIRSRMIQSREYDTGEAWEALARLVGSEATHASLAGSARDTSQGRNRGRGLFRAWQQHAGCLQQPAATGRSHRRPVAAEPRRGVRPARAASAPARAPNRASRTPGNGRSDDARTPGAIARRTPSSATDESGSSRSPGRCPCANQAFERPIVVKFPTGGATFFAITSAYWNIHDESPEPATRQAVSRAASAGGASALPGVLMRPCSCAGTNTPGVIYGNGTITPGVIDQW
jgi:hypothetical protein